MAKQNVTVELFYDGAWQTAPAYVRDPIVINRGRGNETSEPTPQTLTLTLDNRTGDYNPRNGSSPLFGLVGRNTPIRVSVDAQVRFHGEVSSWKPGRTVDFDPDTGRGDAWTQVEAAGVLRRIGQGADVLASPLRRAILDADPTAYWPLEDLDGSPSARSAVDGVGDMVPFGYSRFTAPGSGAPVAAAGLPKFGTGNGIPGSAPVVDLTQGGVLQGIVPAGASDGWRIEFVMVAPRDKAAARIPIRWTTDGTRANWELQIESTGIFATFGDSPTSGASGTATETFNVFDGLPHHYQIEAFESAGSIDARIYIDDVQVATYGGTLTGTPGSIIEVIVNPLEEVNGTESMPVLGHVAVWNPAAGLTTSAVAMLGHAGEHAGDRFDRLCLEEQITGTVEGDDGELETMGVQRSAGLLELLAEVERTDGGLIYEPRDSLGLALRSIRDLYNQTAALTVDYAAGEVAPPFDPVVDDQGTRNDVTARSTTTGADARSVEETGPMSVDPPPDGVGRYSTQLDVNPDVDARLVDIAGWARHKGTVDEVRLPRVTVDLVASPGLAAAATAVDVGDRITVTNLPADVGADEVSLIVLGYTETVGSHRRNITFNAAPASVYDVATQDGDPRVPSDGSTLAADITASATTLSLASATGYGLWTTSAEDFPLDLRVGGERVTVSAISGASSPQTATVSARAVNGVVRAWTAGTEVDVWQPAVVPL